MRAPYFLPALLLLLTLAFTAYTQPVNFEWALGLGGLQNDDSRAVAVDDSGNVYITGSFNHSVDFDPGPTTHVITPAGASDIYIAKFSPSGQLVWVKTYGTALADFSATILINDTSQIFTAGNLGTAIYIKKLAPDGNPIWTKTIAGTGFKVCTMGALDKSNNLLVSGYFKGTVDFDPGSDTVNLTSTGTSKEDAFILKFNSSGDLTWARSFGGTDAERIQSMAADHSDHVYLTGYFYGTVDFDPGSGVANHTSAGLEDIFLMKLDDTGNLLWVENIGGNMSDIASSIAVDSTGNSYLTGSFNGIVDFNPGPGTLNLSSSLAPDAFFCKFNTSGNLQWAKDVGGSFTDRGMGVALDDSSNAYFTGFYEFNNVDFDPGPGTYLLSTAGLIDAFVLKLNSSGGFKWAQSMGGAMEEIGTAITLDKYRNIYTCGAFLGTGDYDPFSPIFNLVHNGQQDIFLQRLSQCRDRYDTLYETSCHLFVSPSGKAWSSSGTFSDTIPNPSGCDSLFTIHLTIDTINTTIIQNGTQLIAGQAGAASYQWLNCDSGYAPIHAALNQSFIPAVNGSYAVVITNNGCTDTSACVIVNDVGTGEYQMDRAPTVYPNPSSGSFTVKLDKEYTTFTLELYNALGRLIWSRNATTATSEYHLQFEGLPGLYFLKIDLPGEKPTCIPLIRH